MCRKLAINSKYFCTVLSMLRLLCTVEGKLSSGHCIVAFIVFQTHVLCVAVKIDSRIDGLLFYLTLANSLNVK